MTPRRHLRAAIAVATAVAASGCGDEGRNADGAYITTAIRHHQVGIALAGLARDARVGAPLKRLGRQLERRHTRAISELEGAHARIFDSPPPASPRHGSLGLTDSDLGLPADPYAIDARQLSPAGLGALLEAHLKGAIRLAEAALREGRDDRVAVLARAAIGESKRALRTLYRATR